MEDVVKVGHWIEIDGYAGAPATAPPGKALLYYNQATGKMMMSRDAGAVSEIPAVSNAAFANILGTPTFTVGTEATDAIIVTVQLYDINGTATAFKSLVHVWLSDAAAGAITGTGPSSTIAISGGSGVIVETVTSKKVYNIITGASGEFKLSLTEAGAATWYMNVALADGRVFSSAAITFAA